VAAPPKPVAAPAPSPAPVAAPRPAPAPSTGVGAAEPAAAGFPTKYVGIAAAAVVVLGLLVWMFVGRGRTTGPTTTTGGTTPPAIGNVVVNVAPWARIDAVTRKSDGAAADAKCSVTPCVFSLPAGDYHVRASNPNFGGAPLEFDVTVAAGAVREVRQTIPGFKPEEEVSKILERQ
jgi:hypothetical protein